MKPLVGLRTKLSDALAILCTSGAFAAWSDDGPIKIIVPQAASGTNDTVTRIIGADAQSVASQRSHDEPKA